MSNANTSNLPIHSEWSAFDILPEMTCIATASGVCEFHNEAWRDSVFDAHPDLSSSRWINELHEPDRQALLNMWNDATKNKSSFQLDFRFQRAAGQRWFRLSVRPRTAPRSKDVFLITIADVYDASVRNLARIESARIQEQMLAASVDCIKMVDVQGKLLQMNRAGCLALNVDEASGFGMDWIDLLAPEVHELGRIALAQAIAGESARFSGISQVAGGETRYWDNMLTPWINEDGKVMGILCVSRDVSTQKRNERRIEVLMHELNHRTRNLLTVVQALIYRAVPDLKADFVQVINKGLAKIARNQELSIRGEYPVKISDVIEAQMSAVGYTNRGKIIFDGNPDIVLRHEAAEVLSLAMHELMTNSVKYGVLSDEAGTITIGWEIREKAGGDCFYLQWKESGKPGGKPSTRRGFGAVMTEHNPQAVLAGKVSCRHDPLGIVWEFEAPAVNVIQG